nr:ferritin light chain-like [Desmodus rotundus]
MSSQICQNYFIKVEAAINCLLTLHLWASYTYLSLGFYFHVWEVALQGMGHFLKLTVQKSSGGRGSLLKMQDQHSGGHIFFQEVLKPYQDEWGDIQDAMDAAMVLEKN